MCRPGRLLYAVLWQLNRYAHVVELSGLPHLRVFFVAHLISGVTLACCADFSLCVADLAHVTPRAADPRYRATGRLRRRH